MKVRDAAKLFEAYDKRTTRKMSQHNRAGGSVRKPVRSTKDASSSDQYDRGKFAYRKAAQAITAGHPLQNDKGEPTPAALQFKRWGFPVPQTQDDLRELKALGARLKERYKPRES
jgi:hypothetical protein